MKHLVLFAFALALAACQGNDDGGSTAITGTATTPLNMTCLNGTSYCNNNVYSQYQGWMPYPGMYNYAYDYTSYFNQYGFCNCPGGYSPVYNGQYGLGCVSAQLLMPYAGMYTYWSWGWSSWGTGYPAPQTTINLPQYSNIPSVGGVNGQCSRNITQSCILSQANSCGAGAVCRQVMGGSNLGVCVR